MIEHSRQKILKAVEWAVSRLLSSPFDKLQHPKNERVRFVRGGCDAGRPGSGWIVSQQHLVVFTSLSSCTYAPAHITKYIERETKNSIRPAAKAPLVPAPQSSEIYAARTLFAPKRSREREERRVLPPRPPLLIAQRRRGARPTTPSFTRRCLGGRPNQIAHVSLSLSPPAKWIAPISARWVISLQKRRVVNCKFLLRGGADSPEKVGPLSLLSPLPTPLRPRRDKGRPRKRERSGGATTGWGLGHCMAAVHKNSALHVYGEQRALQ